MAASKTVVVLAPNGRRQTVKVSPNTTMLQVIEEVCKKQGFKPDEYDLKHHKTVLDTNATMGFSGLPNNAQLELATTTRARIESDVVIGIQLENGNRLLGTFKPGDSVYDVLLKLTPDDLNPERNTVVIYMRREIFGTEVLQKTDLRSLGLTSGRAMFRIIHKAPEELKMQPNISAPLPAKPVEEKPYIRKLQRVESPPRPPTVQPKLQPLIPPPTYKDNDESTAKKTCTEENITGQKPTNFKKTNMVDLIKGEKKKLQQEQKQQREIQERQRSVPKEAMDVDPQRVEDDFVFLGERNAMLFSFETAQSVPTEDLPDDFFDLTIEDAKKLFRDIKKQRMELEDSPLMTSALRNLEESKQQLRTINKYKKTIIRVQFPDRTVLQGTFSTTEDVGTVMDFVRGYLEDKNLDFYLYTTPPKSVLKNDSILFEIGCVPGALLYFGVNSTNCAGGQFLKHDLKNKFTTSSMASLAAAKMRQEARRWSFTEEPDDVTMTPEEDVNIGASTSTSNYVDYDKPSTSTTQTTPKIPKWFKNQ